ncbi:MAG TPA: lysylphosphatidylglycerol synthase transmembrane domain-containing protein [Gaiellaceae bacterium]|jgi:uncharacterized membrane protein YbhN (UPF0104 family)
MTPSRRTLALSLAGLAALAVSSLAAGRFGAHVSPALDVLVDANRLWLAVAVAGFLAAFACSVGAWRAALGAAGGRICPRQAAARLAVGSLVNAFAPAKLGDAVKIALCSRAIDGPGRVWTTGGAYAGLAAVRSLTLACLVVAASATHAMPLWPVFALAGGAAAFAAAAAASSRCRRHARVARFLDGAAMLARRPRALAAVAAWSVGMQIARVAGAVAAAVAFGLPHPLLAALVILPALDVAGAVPLTPGSIGVGSGAVAVALASRGIGMTQALAVGLSIQGVETIVSVGCGTVGAAYLVQPGERARLLAVRVALVAASAAVAAVVGAGVLDLL